MIMALTVLDLDSMPEPPKNPRNTRAPKSGAAKPAEPPRGTSKKSLKAPLWRMYGMAGMAVALLPYETAQADGVAIMSQAEACAEALAKLADNDPKVYKTLERLITASSWGGVIAPHVVLLGAILGNHGINIPLMPNIIDAEPDDDESSAG